MEYLDFEMPIKELEDQLEKCHKIGEESDVDVTATCKKIEKKLVDARKRNYKNLTPGKEFSYLDILIDLIL
jgi:acetyl-CoA carboxylase carboxyl transferase subunit alpha